MMCAGLAVGLNPVSRGNSLRFPAVLARKLQCRQNIGFEISARDGISLLEETDTN